MQTENIEVMCEDGVKLKGILLIPENPKAVIQFNCGTATPMKFYLPFVTYLAENGFLCCLWNYRGSNQSDELIGSEFRYADYGLKDMPAMKSYLEKRFPHLPFLFVGHSTGGQQIGFIENLSNVKGQLNFAVGSGHFPYLEPLGYRINGYFFFYVFAPISALLNGYVKAKPFGFMENMPKNVAFEWRDWLEKPDYFFNEKFYGKTLPAGHFQNFQFPIHNYYATDDSITTERNYQAFWNNIKSEKGITFSKLSPSEHGVKQIDHFGYFKKTMKETLWKDVIKRLNNWL